MERDDAWILEARRLSMSQVILYLGAWVMVVAASIAVTLDRARMFFLHLDDINMEHLVYRYGVLGEVAAIPTARKMILE